MTAVPERRCTQLLRSWRRYNLGNAGVAELADAQDLKSCGTYTPVPVRFRSPALVKSRGNVDFTVFPLLFWLVHFIKQNYQGTWLIKSPESKHLILLSAVLPPHSRNFRTGRQGTVPGCPVISIPGIRSASGSGEIHIS